MARQTLAALQRRDIERLLHAAGHDRTLDELAAGGDHATVVVVVLAAEASGSAPGTVGQNGDEQDCERGSRRTALARRRRELCKTQEGLAAEVGVQRTTVARWESGDTTPSLWARPKLANALGVTLEVLDGLLAAGKEVTIPGSAATDIVQMLPPAVA